MICQALDILQVGRLQNAKTPPNYSIVSKQASLFCGSTSTGEWYLKSTVNPKQKTIVIKLTQLLSF
jgi:hypothetical protein